MRRTTWKPRSALLTLAASLLLAGNAFADKPSWAGGGDGEKGRGRSEARERHEQGERREARGPRHDEGYEPERKTRHEGPVRDGRHGDRRDDARSDHRSRDGATIQLNAYFGDRERVALRDYYGEQFRRGHCPPGLAKKGNGCQPPGQAKKWRVGRPLPRDVVYYDLAPAVVVRIGMPPAGHRYVRVAGDILLIAIGTGMVIDAIEDLGRM